MQQLNNLAYKSGDNIQRLLSEFNIIAGKLNLNDRQKATKFKLLFPKEVRLFLSSRNTGEDLPEICKAIEDYMEVMTFHNTDSFLSEAMKEVRISEDVQEFTPKSILKKEESRCVYCDIYGHLVDDCFSMKKDKIRLNKLNKSPRRQRSGSRYTSDDSSDEGDYYKQTRFNDRGSRNRNRQNRPR